MGKRKGKSFFVRITKYRNVRMNLIKRFTAIKSVQFENTHIHSFINSFIHSLVNSVIYCQVLLVSITFQKVSGSN